MKIRALLCLCVAGTLAAQPGHGESPGDPAFPVGQTFGLWRVQKSATILGQIPGEQVTVQKNDILFEFDFHLKKKVKEVRTEITDEAGKKKVVFREIIVEPAEPREQARLYAVGVKYPRLPLTDELKASLVKLGVSSVPDADQFTISLPSTLIQITFSRYREKRYLEKIVFISREYSAQKIKDDDALKKEQDAEIKRALEMKQAELKTSSSTPPWMRSEIVPLKDSSPESTLQVLSKPGDP